MKKIILTIAFTTISLMTFSQVGINTEEPTETLDVNGTLRIRNIEDINNTERTDSIFNRRIFANKNGVIGYDVNVISSAEKKYQLDNIYQSVMEKPVVAPPGTHNDIDLNIFTTVRIPPGTRSLITVDYNIPGYKSMSIEKARLGYIGITLTKCVDKNPCKELESGSRKYASYESPFAGKGTFIAGKAIDIIDNNTDKEITVKYKPLGYVESNASADNVYFGMWNDTGNNYNWGRGSMTTSVYLKKL